MCVCDSQCDSLTGLGIQVSQTCLCHLKFTAANKRLELLLLAVTHVRFKVLAAVCSWLGLVTHSRARCQGWEWREPSLPQWSYPSGGRVLLPTKAFLMWASGLSQTGKTCQILTVEIFDSGVLFLDGRGRMLSNNSSQQPPPPPPRSQYYEGPRVGFATRQEAVSCCFSQLLSLSPPFPPERPPRLQPPTFPEFLPLSSLSHTPHVQWYGQWARDPQGSSKETNS